MFGFDKEFKLKVFVPDEHKKTALDAFKSMNKKFADMTVYLEKKDTPDSERSKYEPMYMNALRAISQSYNILEAMGITEEEIKKHCKF